jgi:uncharacterized protein involved in copper resistance
MPWIVTTHRYVCHRDKAMADAEAARLQAKEPAKTFMVRHIAGRKSAELIAELERRNAELVEALAYAATAFLRLVENNQRADEAVAMAEHAPTTTDVL